MKELLARLRYPTRALPEHAKIAADRIEQLESQLTAEREARQKAEADRNGAIEQYLESQKAWRAAEQRIKASQEQEPLTDTYVQKVPDKCDRIVWRNAYYHLPLPELSEVVRERDELRRKLEDERFEHRSYIGQMHERFNNETIALRKQLESMMENAIAMSALNPPPIIIESAKRQAVPEGWKLVPIEPEK